MKISAPSNMAAPLETLWKSSQLTQTPVRPGVRVPSGHILVSNKWRGTLLISEIQAVLKVHFEDNLGVVDFHPSSDFGVVYIRESDLASGVDYRKKLLKLQKVDLVRGMVIVEKTITTKQYFPELQKFVVLDVGYTLIPVANQSEAASFLIQMVHAESKARSNSFCLKRPSSPVDEHLLITLQTIPKLGQVKAKALLDHFHSLQNIFKASEDEVAQVVGKANAYHIKQFFHSSGNGSL